MSGTKVYGCSDDLIEIEGDLDGECYASNEDETILIFNDGSMLAVKYGKGGMGIWSIVLVRKGELFLRIEQCSDEDSDPYSDVAYFGDGVKWGYCVTEWKKIK